MPPKFTNLRIFIILAHTWHNLDRPRFVTTRMTSLIETSLRHRITWNVKRHVSIPKMCWSKPGCYPPSSKALPSVPARSLQETGYKSCCFEHEVSAFVLGEMMKPCLLFKPRFNSFSPRNPYLRSKNSNRCRFLGGSTWEVLLLQKR